MSTIEASLVTGYQVKITGNGHVWLADEPASLGGDDEGPTPYEMLLGSLAACTCMTVAMYARRKGWAVDGIAVRFTHAKIHAKDCEECDKEQGGMIDQVHGSVTIQGDLDEEQRKRLAQVAGRCPVNKTLRNGVEIIEQVEFS